MFSSCNLSLKTNLYRDNLEARLRNLQYVRTVWSKGDLKQALEVAIGLNEQGITVDILQVHTVLRVSFPFTDLPGVNSNCCE